MIFGAHFIQKIALKPTNDGRFVKIVHSAYKLIVGVEDNDADVSN